MFHRSSDPAAAAAGSSGGGGGGGGNGAAIGTKRISLSDPAAAAVSSPRTSLSDPAAAAAAAASAASVATRGSGSHSTNKAAATTTTFSSMFGGGGGSSMFAIATGNKPKINKAVNGHVMVNGLSKTAIQGIKAKMRATPTMGAKADICIEAIWHMGVVKGVNGGEMLVCHAPPEIQIPTNAGHKQYPSIYAFCPLVSAGCFSLIFMMQSAERDFQFDSFETNMSAETDMACLYKKSALGRCPWDTNGTYLDIRITGPCSQQEIDMLGHLADEHCPSVEVMRNEFPVDVEVKSKPIMNKNNLDVSSTHHKGGLEVLQGDTKSSRRSTTHKGLEVKGGSEHGTAKRRSTKTSTKTKSMDDDSDGGGNMDASTNTNNEADSIPMYYDMDKYHAIAKQEGPHIIKQHARGEWFCHNESEEFPDAQLLFRLKNENNYAMPMSHDVPIGSGKYSSAAQLCFFGGLSTHMHTIAIRLSARGYKVKKMRGKLNTQMNKRAVMAVESDQYVFPSGCQMLIKVETDAPKKIVRAVQLEAEEMSPALLNWHNTIPLQLRILKENPYDTDDDMTTYTTESDDHDSSVALSDTSLSQVDHHDVSALDGGSNHRRRSNNTKTTSGRTSNSKKGWGNFIKRFDRMKLKTANK